MQVAAAPLPEDSLLARLRGPECYRDAFRVEVPGRVTIAQYIAAFYASAAFTPERLLLGLIGRGGSHAQIAALAEGRAERFAAWTVEAREPASSSEAVGQQGLPASSSEAVGGQNPEILLRDFQNRTCSWLMVEPAVEGEPGTAATTLWFGSAIRALDAPLVRALMPFHRWYSRRLLAGAARALTRQ